MWRLSDPEYVRRVTQLLNRLEELEPVLRQSEHEKRLSRFRNAMAAVSLVAFVLAGMALAIAPSSSCINNVLKSREPVSKRETEARQSYAEAQKQFAVGQVAAVKLILKRDVVDALAKLKTADDTFSDKTDVFIAELKSIQLFRVTHPLGQC